MNLICEIITREKFLLEAGVHPKDALLIILKGSFRCRISGRSYAAAPGDIFVFSKNSPFERKITEPAQFIYIQFDDGFPTPLPDGIMEASDPLRVKNTIYHLERAAVKEEIPLIIHFVQDIFIMGQPNGNRAVTDKTLLECIDFINKNYHEQITLGMLAERFSISKQGLILKFKKNLQRTPMEYLSSLRLLKSKALLKDTDCSVTEIAERCGFESVQYFSIFFKNKTGISPAEYRKSMRI